MIRVGPAGWSYEDWDGIVYPSPAPRGFDPLAYLAGYFDTVEINSTFYRPATAQAARSWLRRVEDNERFRFTAKAWRRFTHEREEALTRDDVAQVRQAFDPLHDAGRLGAVLLQFPWSFKRDDASRHWLDDATRALADYPLALEVRHASWNVPAFYEELAERGVGFVNIDQPLFARSITPSAAATSPVGYVRLHGRNYDDWFREGAGVEARYDYLYSADELGPWVDRTRTVAERAGDVYVVTNNHFQGKAVANGVMLDAMLSGEAKAAPPGVAARYGEALRGYVVG
jgi:uncharacterized protein YecE (DUF72 family)